MKEHLQSLISNLALFCVDEIKAHHEYTDEDLMNATIVFQHVLAARMYSFHRGKLSDEGMLRLAEEQGKSMRQTILLFAGVDMHTIAKKI